MYIAESCPIADSLDLVWVHLDSLCGQVKAQELCVDLIKCTLFKLGIKTMLS